MTLNIHDIRDGLIPHRRLLSSLFALTLSVALGACASADEAASFDGLEDDSDGYEDEAEEFRYVPIYESCGDHTEECIQGCDDDYYQICLPNAASGFESSCWAAAKEVSGLNDCFDEYASPLATDLCWDSYHSCKDGTWRSEIKDAYDAQVSSCQAARLVCKAPC